ncbi:MAG: outer membrane protein assembly factor BamE [Alphaproteobacteria bacterium]|jgi:outer membrane protein assembly factor BamE (lipoprotein component of BamABCDE complex)
MSIRKLFFLCAVLVCSGCSSDVFLDHNGNMPESEKIAQIHNGLTKAEVKEILGAPSLTTGLSDDHWIYMSSTIRRVAFIRPTELDRQVLALTFDDDKVSKIDTRTLADGNNIAIDGDKTLAADRKQGFFQKYFGGVGAYMPFGNGKSDKGL